MGLGPVLGGTPIFGLRREIDRLFEDAFGGGSESRALWAPPVDISETDGELEIDLELPGIKPENVDLNVENGVLTVTGEKREERKEGEEGRQHVVERRYGRFVRTIQLPTGVDEEQISANFDNGVLSIRVPKAALPQPRRIQIGTGNRPAVSGGTQGQERGRTGSRTETRGGREEGSERMVAGGAQSQEEERGGERKSGARRR
jgi:HSP20 family protein